MSEFVTWEDLVDWLGEEQADLVRERHRGYGPSDNPYWPLDDIQDIIGMMELEAESEESGEP